VRNRYPVFLIVAIPLLFSSCDKPGAPSSAPEPVVPFPAEERETTPPPQAPSAFLQERGDPERKGRGIGPVPDFPLQLLWSWDGDTVRTPPLVQDGYLYAAGSFGRVVSLATGTGTVRWSFDAGAPIPASPALAGDRLVFSDAEGVLHVLDSESGKEYARIETGVLLTSPLLVADMAVVGGADGSVSAYDLRSGSAAWKVSLEGKILGAPSFRSGKVFAGTSTGIAASLSIEDGKIAWKRRMGGAIHGSLAASGDSVVGATLSGEYFCLNADSGEARWNARIGESFLVSPAVGEKRAFFSGLGGSVLAVDLANGLIAWRRNLRETSAFAPVFVDDGILFATEESLLHHLEAADGASTGWFSLPLTPVSGPLCFNGLIFIGKEGGLVAFRGGTASKAAKENKTYAFATLPLLRTDGREHEVFLPPEGRRLRFLPGKSGVYFMEIAGSTQKPVTMKLLDEEGTVLEENIEYTALERGFSYRYTGGKKYFVELAPVNLEGGLVPARIRAKEVGR